MHDLNSKLQASQEHAEAYLECMAFIGTAMHEWTLSVSLLQ